MRSTHIVAALGTAKFSAKSAWRPISMCYLQGAMADASSSARRPAPEEGPLTRWSTWAIVGGVLLGGVVVWRLWGSTYKTDVRTICNAEKGSGFTIEKDTPKVAQWIRGNLETPEGNTFFSTLSDTRMSERAKRLQTEADSVKLAACPMVTAYEQLTAVGEHRSDLQHLCSSLTFPKLAELDDEERLARLEDWLDKQAKSPRTKELADPMRTAPPAGRGKLLRDTASSMDVFTCDVAKTLDSPQAEPKPSGVPMVRVWAAPQVIGSMKEEDLAKPLADATPALNDCYKKGLAKKPDLAGKLAIKLQVSPDGKVTKASPADLALEDHDTVACILDVIKGLSLPKNPGPLASVFIPLELTTKP
jgi:hypothetical protein